MAPIDLYNKIVARFQHCCAGMSSAIMCVIFFHVISVKISRLVKAFSFVKVTWALISFVGRPNTAPVPTIISLITSILLIAIAVGELKYQKYFHDELFLIPIDMFFTFISLTKVYFQYVHWYLKVENLTSYVYVVQTLIVSIAAWKTHDENLADRNLPFALAYTFSMIYYLMCYLIYLSIHGLPEYNPNMNENENETENDKKDELENEKNQNGKEESNDNSKVKKE